MNLQDKATVPTAAGAVAWPWIHEYLEILAHEAQLILPVLGMIWLSVQIAAKIYQVWIKSD